MTTPVPLWLDCDPGHDDVFALVLAGQHPSLNLLGVSTVHGNASLANTTVNALSVLTAIGRPDVPVYAGASKPFCRTHVHASDIHGETGLDGTNLLPAPAAEARKEPAVLAMAAALAAQPKGTAWVVATGALTNIALLFAVYPELAEHVRGVSIMGGAIGGGFTEARLGKVEGEGERFGNITPFAEFNIYVDPESSHSLLSNSILAPKTTLITLDLTHLVLVTPAIQEQLLGSKDGHGASDIRAMLHDLVLFFAGTYSRVFGISEGPPLHDPLAVAIILEDVLLRSKSKENGCFDDHDGKRYAVGVVTDGSHLGDRSRTGGGDGTVPVKGKAGQVGRTIVQAVGGGGVRIPNSIDVDWFWREMLESVSRAEAAVKVPER